MTISAMPTGTPDPPPGAVMDTASRSWGAGWRRYFFPGFWLVYLGQAVGGVAKHAHGPERSSATRSSCCSPRATSRH